MPTDQPETASVNPKRDPTAWIAAPLILFAAAFFVLYMGVIQADDSGKRWLGAGDPWAYAGPVLHFLDHRLHDGEFPLWNPLINCGQPHAANPQSFVFYPPNLIRSILTFNPTPYKTHAGIAVLVLLHLWAGGLGAFALARRHKLSIGASLAAGFIFMLSAGALTRAIGHWYFHQALAWAPWLLCCAHAALNSTTAPQRRRWILGCGMIYGLILLAGTPHFMVLIGYLLAWYWIIWRIALFFGSSKGTWPALAKNLSLDMGRLALVAGIGVLVAAPLVFPAYEFSTFTARAASAVDVELIPRSGPPWNLWQLLVIYSGDGTYEGIRGSGALAMILALTALAGLATPRRRAIAAYAAFFFIALDCSVDHPILFGRIFHAISPYPISAPPRGILLACLPLGMLAAFAIHGLTEAAAEKKVRWIQSGALAAAALVVLGTIAYVAVPHPFLNVGPAIIVVPAVAVLACLALIWKPVPFIGSIVVSMLVFGEIFIWSYALLPHWTAEGVQFPDSPEVLRGEREFWQDNSRGTDKRPNSHMYDLEPAINGYDPLFLSDVADIMAAIESPTGYRRMILFEEPTALSFHGLLFLKRQFWLARKFVDGPLPAPTQLFPPTTTVFLEIDRPLPVEQITREKVRERAVSASAETIPLMEPGQAPLVISAEAYRKQEQAVSASGIDMPKNHSAMAFEVQSTTQLELEPIFADIPTEQQELGKALPVIPTEANQAIYYEVPLPDFSKLEFAIKPNFGDASGEIAVTNLKILNDVADENSRIAVEHRSANRVRVKLSGIPGNRILLNVDAAYPGWNAYVDGKPTPIIRANGAFKGVVVPPGDHTVEFVFRPMTVYAGLATSFVTLCAAAAFLLRPAAFRGQGDRRKRAK